MRTVYLFAFATIATTFAITSNDNANIIPEKCETCDVVSMKLSKTNDSIVLDNSKMSESIISRIKSLDSINNSLVKDVKSKYKLIEKLKNENNNTDTIFIVVVQNEPTNDN
jgi:hypothetical protein